MLPYLIYHKNMKVLATLFVSLLVITGVFATSNLRLQFGSYVARAVGTSGRFSIVCTGGSGSYNYQISGLPAGWTASGNTVSVPRINTISGQSYSLDIQVRDARTGEILNSNIILTINGVRVNLAQGGAIGGTFGSINGLIGGASGSAGVSTGSSASQTTQTITQTSVSSLYESYAGIPAGAATPLPVSTYSSPAGNPSIPNPAPAIIATAQAQYNTARDANTITVDDVKRTAIFNRQITANKAVANLVSIVQKLTANVNAATNDLTVLTKVLADAEGINAQCEGVIFDLYNTKAKIENAIADRETSIADINGRIEAAQPMLNGLKSQLDKLISQRRSAESQTSPNAAKLADLQTQLDKCMMEKNQLQTQLQNVQNEIAGIKVDIQNTRDSAAAAPGIVSQINRQIPIIDNKIADLKRQIEAAENEKVGLIADKTAAENLIRSSAAEVTRLQGVLSGLEQRVPGLQRDISAKQAQCDQIQRDLNSFRSELAQIESNYKTLLDEITAQNALIAQKQAEIDALVASIGELPNELKLLRAEYSRVDAAIRRQSYICEATADDVRRAKQNAEAMRVRLNTDSQSLRTANANLEAARAEKELADIAVEEIISVYTQALPFSIVPNGGSTQYGGTPLGNNPSGSPLGAVGSATQQQNRVTIGDLNSYLSSAYRTGVDPARPSTVTTLYPLSVATISTISGASAQSLYSFSCDSSANNVVYGSGLVQSVNAGSLRLTTSNGPVNLQVSGCTNMESVNQGQVLGANDMVYFRGQNLGNGFINAHSVTCV